MRFNRLFMVEELKTQVNQILNEWEREDYTNNYTGSLLIRVIVPKKITGYFTK